MSIFAAVMTGQGVGAISSIQVFGKEAEYIIKKIDPMVILDLGCGSGAYGQVLKTENPELEIIGVDGCFKYLTSVFCLKSYSARIHMDIVDFLNSSIEVKQDLTLCMDVIEHFEKDEAWGLLENLPTPLIISTPLYDYPQGTVEGNPLEEHKCFFTEDELISLGFDKLYSYTYDEGDIGAFIR